MSCERCYNPPPQQSKKYVKNINDVNDDSDQKSSDKGEDGAAMINSCCGGGPAEKV